MLPTRALRLAEMEGLIPENRLNRLGKKDRRDRIDGELLLQLMARDLLQALLWLKVRTVQAPLRLNRSRKG